MSSSLADRLVSDVLDAVADGAPARARVALHPYLRWTDPAGNVVFGRTRILTALEDRSLPLTPPSALELHDGQIFRWTEPPES